MMHGDDPFDVFLEGSRVKEDQLLHELRSYHPRGTTRLWAGPSIDHLREVTEDRVAEIEREIARIAAAVEFVTVLRDAMRP